MMTPQQRQFWQYNRTLGPLLLFGAVLFSLQRFLGVDPMIAVAVAAFLALVDFYILSWLMTRAEKRE